MGQKPSTKTKPARPDQTSKVLSERQTELQRKLYADSTASAVHFKRLKAEQAKKKS